MGAGHGGRPGRPARPERRRPDEPAHHDELHLRPRCQPRVRPRWQHRLGRARGCARRSRGRARRDIRIGAGSGHRDRRSRAFRWDSGPVLGHVLRRQDHLRADAGAGPARPQGGAEGPGAPAPRGAPPDDPATLLAAADGADMVWVESIANPLLVVADVTAIATGARERGALPVVDATFATPLRQRPLELGADIVLHSATKLIGGHSDLLLGAAVCSDEQHAAFLVGRRHDHGAVPGGLEAFLALRGLRTLAVRLDRAEASAAELARRLSTHAHVSTVYYPGLPCDTQYERASRVLPDGAGSMVAFEVAGSIEETDAFLEGLRLVTHATSLGGVESLIERRSRYAGDAAVVGATHCRLSVGIENVEDLWSDIDGALRAVLD